MLGAKCYEIYKEKSSRASIRWSNSTNTKPAYLTDKSRQRHGAGNQEKKPSARFVCDGRQYCSQMRSREEAEYFNQYCPNTKMDGDHDGHPCENHSAW
ncbi:MAG: calcium-binding protein [Gammaproteobacteria bacterium]|nr:MAG: calcium-binding protein [Gammaproteobacteria bacterium]